MVSSFITAEYVSSQPLPLDFLAFRGVWGSLALGQSCAAGEDSREWRLAELTFSVLAAAGIEIEATRQRYLMDCEADFQHAVVGAERAEVTHSLARIPLAGSFPGSPIETQVFWRRAHTDFSESESHRIQTAAGCERRTVLLVSPLGLSLRSKCASISANRAGLAKLFDLRLLDDTHNALWEWDLRAETLAETVHEEMSFLAARDGEGAAILYLHGSDPRLILPIPETQLAPLCRGGSLAAEFAWTDPEIDFRQWRALMYILRARMVCRYLFHAS